MLTRALKTLSRVHSCNAKQSGQLRCECEDCSVSRVPASSLRVGAPPYGCVVSAWGSALRQRRYCMRQRLVIAQFAVSSAAGGESCALKLSRLGNGLRLLRAVVMPPPPPLAGLLGSRSRLR